MPFRLRRDTRKWFQDISTSFEVDFDMYYLCFVAGLAAGARNAQTKTAETTELVENFPGPYREKSRIIIALFLSLELQRLEIDRGDREAVHKQIVNLVDPRTPSQLSDAGMKLMNEISYGGFDVLTEEFDDRPRSIEAFLSRYCRMIGSAGSAK